ncbi:helix-turn-helix domain-containing protein [Pseudonocardia broussonetiae]|uniref:Helix-turn-helix transcriptional regulator n=1 Tax=Pseudonocardia broussonetiae TaxID=2736640 RepID=A0A6M6JCA2_9PSEU|nr:AraC family transcriptional regulator [Pseudonocardia broussonetiae]QJY45196.1 helix-turn-helix transcriptional regulator [Pseudonocardia broussonetiae]
MTTTGSTACGATAGSGSAPGWTSMSLRRVHDRAEVEDFRIAAADVQRVVLLESGTKWIESAAGGRWQGAVHAPGTLGLTAPGRATRLRWRATSDEPVVTLQVTVPGPVVRGIAEQVWGRAGTPVLDSLSTDDPTTAVLLGAAAAAQRAGAPDLYAQSAAQFLVTHLLTHHAGLPAPRRPTREERRTARVLAYMAAHLEEQLTLSELAGVAGLSPYHFLRVFKATTGRTPMRRLTELRVEAAQRLLRGTDQPVTRIAYACGFSSPGHLAASFARHVGTTPSRYRAQHT